MKRLSLYLFLLLFTLQTPSQADDIRDFQIEGMSIRDSLLDYFSEAEINKQKETLYPSKKFYYMVVSHESDSSPYDRVEVSIKNNDRKYTVYGVSGTVFFEDNINKCYKKKDEIVRDLFEMFKDVTKKDDVGTFTMNADTSGESTATTVNFIFDSGDFISVQCKDWSEKMNLYDRLKITIVTKEYHEFTLNEAY